MINNMLSVCVCVYDELREKRFEREKIILMMIFFVIIFVVVVVVVVCEKKMMEFVRFFPPVVG